MRRPSTHPFSTVSSCNTTAITSHVQCSTAARKQTAGDDGNSSSVRPHCPPGCRCDQTHTSCCLQSEASPKQLCDQHGLVLLPRQAAPGYGAGWQARRSIPRPQCPPAAAARHQAANQQMLPAAQTQAPAQQAQAAAALICRTGTVCCTKAFLLALTNASRCGGSMQAGRQGLALPLSVVEQQGDLRFETLLGHQALVGAISCSSPEWLGATAHINTFHWRLLLAACV